MNDRVKKCPICGKAQAADTKPFCSKRCVMIDLSRWLGEGYKIQANEAPDDEPSDLNDDESE